MKIKKILSEAMEYIATAAILLMVGGVYMTFFIGFGEIITALPSPILLGMIIGPIFLLLKIITIKWWLVG